MDKSWKIGARARAKSQCCGLFCLRKKKKRSESTSCWVSIFGFVVGKKTKGARGFLGGLGFLFVQRKWMTIQVGWLGAVPEFHVKFLR